MRTAYSVEQVRRAEAALMATLPEGALMQRAAVGLAVECARLLPRVYGASVVALVGSGDNGGDALYAAAWLGRRGARVGAVLMDPARAHADALAAFRAAGGRAVLASDAWSVLGEADLVLDGITGIGGKGGLRPDAQEVVWEAASCGAIMVAVDVPSGVDADSGEVFGGSDVVAAGSGGASGSGGSGFGVGSDAGAGGGVHGADGADGADVGDSGRPGSGAGDHSGTGDHSDAPEVRVAAVRADVTVTFGAYKRGLLIDPGAAQAGDVRFVDIGLAAELSGVHELEALEADDVAALLPRPGRESDKYRRGVVGIVAGSPKYPGAAVLAVGSALRSGVGAVRFLGEPTVSGGVLARHPEVLVSDAGPAEAGRVQAWVVGPGLGTSLMAAERLEAVLAQPVPVLIDADGLTLLKQYGQAWLRARRAPTLLTPHAGEAARLLDGGIGGGIGGGQGTAAGTGSGWDRERIEARRLAAVRTLADRFGCTVLLKGSTTLIADPGRAAVRVNPTGTPALATAGSGDVLSGLAGGLIAAGLSTYDAASVAAWLHGSAARSLQRTSSAPVAASDLIDALYPPTPVTR